MGECNAHQKLEKKEVLGGFDIETPEPSSPKDVIVKSHHMVTCLVASCDHQYVLANRYSALMLFQTDVRTMKIFMLNRPVLKI